MSTYEVEKTLSPMFYFEYIWKFKKSKCENAPQIPQVVLKPFGKGEGLIALPRVSFFLPPPLPLLESVIGPAAATPRVAWVKAPAPPRAPAPAPVPPSAPAPAHPILYISRARV